LEALLHKELRDTFLKAILRLYEASMKALLRLYEGSITQRAKRCVFKGSIRLYEGSFKALPTLKLY
jgi:hypothetical protein